MVVTKSVGQVKTTKLSLLNVKQANRNINNCLRELGLRKGFGWLDENNES